MVHRIYVEDMKNFENGWFKARGIQLLQLYMFKRLQINCAAESKLN